MRFSILATAYSASMRRQSTLTGMRFVVFPYVGAWTFWDWTSSASTCFSSNVLILRVYRKPCTFAPPDLEQCSVPSPLPERFPPKLGLHCRTDAGKFL